MQARVFLGSSTLDRSASGSGCILAMGNFDGVHRGHSAVLHSLVSWARAESRPSLVYTFHPLPQSILRPQERYPRILSLEDRVRLLCEAGVDLVCVERFTAAWARHTAAWFVEVVLQRRIQPAGMVLGHDFRFGYRARGDRAFLQESLPDLPLRMTPALLDESGVISSSRIREAVSLGQVEHARALLGRPHRLKGTVVEGYRRGRQLGFPTANLDTETELVPAPGVYAVLARVDGGPLLQAVTSVGFRPTFGDLPLAIETHILELPHELRGEELYGRELELLLLHRIREERRFEGAEALIAQMTLDLVEARRLLEASP